MQRQDGEYEAAMERCLAIEPSNFEWVGGRKPTRDELHHKSNVLNSDATCSSERRMGPREQPVKKETSLVACASQLNRRDSRSRNAP